MQALELKSIIECERRTNRRFSRAEILKKLDRFCLPIEQVAATIADYSQKEHFLNSASARNGPSHASPNVFK